jgi:hypothetical protein
MKPLLWPDIRVEAYRLTTPREKEKIACHSRLRRLGGYVELYGEYLLYRRGL